jgi:hypothetical protein
MRDWIGPASRTPTRQELVKNETRKKKETLVVPFTVQWSLTYETKDGKTKILKYFLVFYFHRPIFDQK